MGVRLPKNSDPIWQRDFLLHHFRIAQGHERPATSVGGLHLGGRLFFLEATTVAAVRHIVVGHLLDHFHLRLAFLTIAMFRELVLLLNAGAGDRGCYC